MMTNPPRKFRTLKERIADARANLGSEKGDAILAAALATWQKDHGGEFLTLARQAEVLEQAIAAKSPSRLQSDRLPAPVVVARPQTAIGAPELCSQYDALTLDSERRAFWTRHEATLSAPKANIGGLILVCMSAAKPFSMRARLELPITGKASDLVMTTKERLALTPYEQGEFLARGGKFVAEKIKRSLFDRLSPRDQTEFCKTGGKLID
jgi:hypothetical protein